MNTPSEAVHQRLARELEAAIAGGQYQPGARLPAEPRLAAELGVSRGTLRQALATLRQRGLIVAVPARGNFVRSGTPQEPSSRRRLVGVVVPSVAKPYVADLLAGIEDELHRLGYAMLVGSSGATREQQSGRVHRILDERAAGLIAYPIDYDPDPGLFTSLHSAGFPVVLIDRHIVGADLDAVLADNVGGAFAAVTHLVEEGHRRIAFISTDNLTTTSVAERLLGYQQALLAAGIEGDSGLVFSSLPVTLSWPSDMGTTSGENVGRIGRFLERSGATAAFVLHDRLAVDVLEAARRLGRRVPDGLAVVGFDDDPLAGALAVPLSTVAQPRERIGRIAAQLVVDRIEGRRHDVSRSVLSARLVVRRSSVSAAAATA